MISTNRRPLIGIPAAVHERPSAPGAAYYQFNGNYPAALAASGALPVVIPLGLPEDALADLFARLDGLCLAGGVDVDPAHFGEARHPALGHVDAPRDATELTLARWALAADLPIFGICRGIQLLNVAAGGSLYQDLAAQMPAAQRHNFDLADSPWERPVHAVRVAEDSRLAALVGTGEVMTNSFHHQAVKEVAAGFVPSAWTADGVVEGIEAPDHRFALGVQWHPEGMFATDPLARELFAAFVAACRDGNGRQISMALTKARNHYQGAMNTPSRMHAITQFAVPVGVFDSGVGGLSVAREIMALLPAQPIIYLADQAHAPYGQRPLTEIRALSEGIARFLLAEGAGVIVIACNTASAAALHGLREQFPAVPFVGMEPAVKPAVEHTRTGQVGVIATAATFQGELFASLLDRYAGRVAIHTQICPELVPLVEAGELDSPRARGAVAQYLAPLLAAGIDQLVLGCTHYPFLRPLIEEMAGAGVAVIDPAPAVARQTGRVLAQHGWLAETCRWRRTAQASKISDALNPHTTSTQPVTPSASQPRLRDLLGVTADVRQAAWQQDNTLLPAR